LVVSGTVEKFAEISAREIKLHGPKGEPIVAYVTIKPRKKYPFKIVEVILPKNAKVQCKVTEVGGPKKDISYKVRFKNNTSKLGYYLDTVTLVTDSELRPEIFINVSGRVYELPKKKKKD
jgi:hypothetical protein